LRVGFILARQFTLCAFANFVDVLRLAADEGDRSRPILCEWAVLSDTMDPVKSSCGVLVQPNTRLTDATGFDYIVVVGGLMSEIPNLSRATVRFLLQASSRVPLVGVCTGTFILHRAGLMDGYKCCVSWFHHADFLEQFDGLTPVSDQIFVIDRDRLTCSGGASSAHLAAYLVEKHVGPSQAQKSLQIMIIDQALQAEKAQPAIPLEAKSPDDLVRRALAHMQQNIAAPLAISEIAARIGSNRRQLERRFEQTIGAAPSASYMAMRLQQAEMLLGATNQSVAMIAAATGFCDASQLTRVLKKRRGSRPAVLRAKLNRPRSEYD
jgi:transcriptional regulator GlxA family with amidase domain